MAALPTTGITTTLVGTTLGVSSRDVGTLCTHPNINMWSKYKPVSINNAAPERSTDWWKGEDGTCNIKYYVSNSYQNVINQIKDGLGMYQYKTIPTNYPKRLYDFSRYNKDAKKPFEQIINKSISLNDNAANVTMYETEKNDYSITLEDISDFKNWYFAFILCDSLGNPLKGICASKNLYNSKSAYFAQSKDIFIKGKGDYICYPMLVNANLSTKQDLSDWNTSYQYATLNQNHFILSVIDASDAFIRLNASYSYRNGVINAITFEAIGTNRTNVAMNPGTVKIDISYKDPDTDKFVTVYTIIESSVDSIPANTESYSFRNIGGSISTNLLEQWYEGFDYYVEISTGNSMIEGDKVLVK